MSTCTKIQHEKLWEFFNKTVKCPVCSKSKSEVFPLEIEFRCFLGHVIMKPLKTYENIDAIVCIKCTDIDLEFMAVNLLQFDPALKTREGSYKRRAPLDVLLEKANLLS